MADGAGPAPRGGEDDRVAAYLRTAILDGRLTPGQRLVEADLTPALGVGRGVLREAFRRLAAEGMVELAPNRGAQVQRLRRTEALELLEIRAELEAFAARRAAAQMADPRLRRTFTEATARIAADGAAAGGDYIAENREYHAALVAAAGNAQLTETHRRLPLSLILAQIRFALEPSDIAASRAEHKAIAETLLAGDAAAAEAAVRAHLDRAREILRRAPPTPSATRPIGSERRCGDGFGPDQPFAARQVAALQFPKAAVHQTSSSTPWAIDNEHRVLTTPRVAAVRGICRPGMRHPCSPQDGRIAAAGCSAEYEDGR